MIELSKSEQRVDAVLRAHNLTTQIVRLGDNAHTAQQAADGLGIDVAQIVKSLIFRGTESDKAYLLLVSGSNRVHETCGPPDWRKTGPCRRGFCARTHRLCHRRRVAPSAQPGKSIFSSMKLCLTMRCCGAAAGHPKSVFETNAHQLVTLTGAKSLNIL